jgi:tetratricopeptide (TPR) repeat protein
MSKDDEMTSLIEHFIFRKTDMNVCRCTVFCGILFFPVIVAAGLVVLLLTPTSTVSSGASSLTRTFSSRTDAQKMPQPMLVTPTSTINPSQTAQNQQISDNTIANDTITVAGVFAAVVAVLLGILTLAAAIATGIGILELRRIRRFRKGFNEKLKQLDKKLKQLDKRIDTENQKYVEAAYFYSEGTKDYRAGDNKHAIENYVAALKILPESPRIMERIGRAYSNLNEEEGALEYLKKALALDPDYEPALRSLALYHRYTNRQEAIRLLKQILAKNKRAYEAWDFLGLCYRDQLQHGEQLSKDQEIIDKAINAHEEALKIKKRPETEFYLGILLFFSPEDDKNRAKELLILAAKGVEEQEHDVRIRDVWKKLILVGVPVVENNKTEALQKTANMIQYKPSQRIYIGVESHLRFLLEGTGHSDWIEDFMSIVNGWKES